MSAQIEAFLKDYTNLNSDNFHKKYHEADLGFTIMEATEFVVAQKINLIDTRYSMATHFTHLVEREDGTYGIGILGGRPYSFYVTVADLNLAITAKICLIFHYELQCKDIETRRIYKKLCDIKAEALNEK